MTATTPIADHRARRFDQVALLLLLLVSAGTLSLIAWQFAAAVVAVGAWSQLGSRRTRAGFVARCAGCEAEAGACFCDRLIARSNEETRPPAYDQAA